MPGRATANIKVTIGSALIGISVNALASCSISGVKTQLSLIFTAEEDQKIRAFRFFGKSAGSYEGPFALISHVRLVYAPLCRRTYRASHQIRPHQGKLKVHPQNIPLKKRCGTRGMGSPSMASKRLPRCGSCN